MHSRPWLQRPDNPWTPSVSELWMMLGLLSQLGLREVGRRGRPARWGSLGPASCGVLSIPPGRPSGLCFLPSCGPSLISARTLQTSAVAIKQSGWKGWLAGGVGWFRVFLWRVPAPQFWPYLHKAWDIRHLLKHGDSYLEPKDIYFVKKP